MTEAYRQIPTGRYGDLVEVRNRALATAEIIVRWDDDGTLSDWLRADGFARTPDMDEAQAAQQAA